MECGVFYMLDWRFTAMCYDITYLMHVLLCHIKYQLLVDWISTTEDLKPEFRNRETTLLLLNPIAHNSENTDQAMESAHWCRIVHDPDWALRQYEIEPGYRCFIKWCLDGRSSCEDWIYELGYTNLLVVNKSHVVFLASYAIVGTGREDQPRFRSYSRQSTDVPSTEFDITWSIDQSISAERWWISSQSGHHEFYSPWLAHRHENQTNVAWGLIQHSHLALDQWHNVGSLIRSLRSDVINLRGHKGSNR